MKPQEDRNSQEYIDSLKKQFPEITNELTLTKGGEEYKCYLKNPNRAILEQALGLIGKTRGNPEMIRAGEVILLGCWVTGDEVIKTEDDLLVSFSLQAIELIETHETSLKKI